MFKQQKQKDEKKPAMMMVLLLVTATAAMVVITATPWNYIPAQITENAEVLAVIDAGCVVETSNGHSYVVSGCNYSVGDVISVTFHVPGAELNGYYDKVQDKLKTVKP